MATMPAGTATSGGSRNLILVAMIFAVAMTFIPLPQWGSHSGPRRSAISALDDRSGAW